MKSEKGICDRILNDKQLNNIVWQISEPAQFRQAALMLAEDAAEQGRSVFCIRFSEQPVLAEAPRGADVIDVTLTHRFENFTVCVYRELLKCPEGALFLFDSLSDLQTAWATDLMMENFFRVITPVVRERKGTALYPLFRGKHSHQALSRIREQTEVFLDLYSDFRNLYLRAQKIGDVSEQTLFMPHVYSAEQADFLPVTDGILTSRFQKALNIGSRRGRDLQMDAWDRFFDDTQRDYESGRDIEEACSRMCNIMMSRDPKMRDMIREHFEPEDYFFVKEHMIGTGLIGGKACGMLTARKIIENELPELYEKLEPHDSWYIGSDVFYSYLVENELWDLRVRQRQKEGYFTLAEELSERLAGGRFSAETEEAFRHLLEYYGQAPIIVRSSSILEDGFGNAFAGKYESVFCANTGSPSERLKALEDAVRTVYASTLSRSALDYRLRRGLADRDEQMALLVQRVSGSHYGDYFMPCAAGVGYSYSTYRFLEDLDPEAGMLRLVMGLGTSAVDRTEGSYPRLVSLDRPEALSFKSKAEHHRYCQQSVEVINKKSRELERLPLMRFLDLLPDHIRRQMLSHDRDAERRFRDRGIRRDVLFISCDGLAGNSVLMQDMRDMLRAVQDSYGQAVDIEFTMNFDESGEYMINLLQCRPLQAFRDEGAAEVPDELPGTEEVLTCSHTSMGHSQTVSVDAVVYVDPVAYYRMPYQEKPLIARLIGRVSWQYRESGKKLLLMVPGRIGTSSPELGVPVTFADISSFCAIFEIAESSVGYRPELSYGSHMFQDLVENRILYTAVFEDERTSVFRPDIICAGANEITEFDPRAEKYGGIIGLYQMKPGQCTLYHDLKRERLSVRMQAAQTPREKK